MHPCLLLLTVRVKSSLQVNPNLLLGVSMVAALVWLADGELVKVAGMGMGG